MSDSNTEGQREERKVVLTNQCQPEAHKNMTGDIVQPY